MKPAALLPLLLPLAAADAQHRNFRGALVGFQEVPAISTPAGGRFQARISDDGAAIHYQLSYRALEGDVSMAHIDVGQKSVNGGIAVWLCSNLGTPGVQACPAPPATISGIVMAADVVGPAGQGRGGRRIRRTGARDPRRRSLCQRPHQPVSGRRDPQPA